MSEEPEHEPENEPSEEEIDAEEPEAIAPPRRGRRSKAEAAEERDPAEVQAAKMENAQRKYRRDLEGIVGSLEGMADCPLCNGFSLVPSPDALEVRTDTARCPDCKGLGRMLTGSLVQEHAALPCPKCNDSGYVHVQPENVHAIAPATAQAALPAQQVHGYWDPLANRFVPYGEAASTS